jgi:hypothetical protein
MPWRIAATRITATHHCDELLLIVVSATIVVTKAMHDNDEDL